MKKYLLIGLLFFAGFSMSASAQTPPTGENNLVISGKVTDENDFEMEGVSIKLKDNSIQGTKTDEQGYYTITLPREYIGKTLVYDYDINYHKEIKIREDFSGDVKLSSVIELEEVVAMGHSIMSKNVTVQNGFIRGFVTDINNNSLKGIEIHSKKLTEIASNFQSMIDYWENIEMPSNNNLIFDFDLYDDFLDSIETKIENLNKKSDGSVYKISNKSGAFIFGNKLALTKGTYDLVFIDPTGKYKKIEKTVNINEENSRIELGNIKMYTGCETGGQYDPNCLFPSWKGNNKKTRDNNDELRGVYGKNNDKDFSAEAIIANVINIILKFISPIVVVMFIYSGIRFIYAGSDEDELGKAKNFFLYAAIGLSFIIMSYSLMKVIYFFLK